MPGLTQAEGEWAVFDSNAYLIDDATQKTRPRIHTVRPGRNYALTNDTPFWMPEADARIFLKDASFIVWNENQEVVPSLAAQALERNVPKELPPNLVVADLNELTMDALLTRAAQKPGGNRFTSETRREAIVLFLEDQAAGGQVQMDQMRARQPRNAPDTAADVEDFDEDGDEARKMLMGA